MTDDNSECPTNNLADTGNMSLSFAFINVSQVDDISDKHPLVLLESNKRHNPINSIPNLKKCPEITNDFPFFFYVYKNDRIMASCKVFPDTLFANGVMHKWAWAEDLYADPEFRGQGAGSFLWKKQTETILQLDYCFGGAFASPVTIHLSRKLGFTIPERAHRLIVLKNCQSLLRAHSKFTYINIAIDACFRLFIRVAKATILRPKSFYYKTLSAKKVNTSETEQAVDAFNGLKYDEPYHFNDNASRMIWKAEHKPNNVAHIVHHETEQDKVLYFILKERYIEHKFAGRYSDLTLMTLMDFGFHSDRKDNFDILLSFVEKAFWEGDSEVLEIITSNPVFIKKAYRKGFIKAGKGIEFFFKCPAGKELSSESEAINNWRFTNFISDSYSFG